MFAIFDARFKENDAVRVQRLSVCVCTAYLCVCVCVGEDP
jgi:hypothetical protein